MGSRGTGFGGAKGAPTHRSIAGTRCIQGMSFTGTIGFRLTMPGVPQ
jgi:hypothetical protein